MTVMYLLCQGKSYKEMAENLGIKPTALRSHLKLIYDKLQVANGIDAVAKIESLRLLQ